MKPVIQTPRLSFRDFTMDDYDAVHVYASDPEVTRYTAFGPNTPEQTKGFLQLVSGESSQEDRANYSFALIHKQTNKLIGSCGLMRSDTNGPQYSFGYVLHKDWWRQGLASEATAALVKFGFDELQCSSSVGTRVPREHGVGEAAAEAGLQARRLHAEVVLRAQRVARPADVRDVEERVGKQVGVRRAHSP